MTTRTKMREKSCATKNEVNFYTVNNANIQITLTMTGSYCVYRRITTNMASATPTEKRERTTRMYKWCSDDDYDSRK